MCGVDRHWKTSYNNVYSYLHPVSPRQYPNCNRIVTVTNYFGNRSLLIRSGVVRSVRIYCIVIHYYDILEAAATEGEQSAAEGEQATAGEDKPAAAEGADAEQQPAAGETGEKTPAPAE